MLAHKGSDVENVRPGASVTEVADILSQKKIGAVLVMDGEKILGIVNERSIVKAVANHGSEALDKPVSDIMTVKVMECSPDSILDSVASGMTKMRMRHLPVMEEGKLIGIVSIGDVLKHRIVELKSGDVERFQHWFQKEGIRPLGSG